MKPISKDRGETVKCTSTSDCYSTDYLDDLYGLVFYSECECGWNAKGDAYCSLMPGEPIMADYLAKLKDWYNSDAINKCNTVRRLEQKCIEAHWGSDDYDEYMYLYWRYTLWPLL